MKKKSIKGALIFGIPGLIMICILCLIIATQLSTKKVFTEHAHSIMQNTAACTIDKARSHLNPARDAAQLTSALAINNIVTSKDVSKMEHYFYEQLQINSQFSNIYYGMQNGEFIMASREGNDHYLSKYISYVEGVRQVQFKEMNLDLSLNREYEDLKDSYDPRSRPWYEAALQEGGGIWTSPYVFFTSKNPGITTASPVYNTEGRVVGVVGVDIEISDLSEFIATLKIGRNGKAFILDEKGKVIAYPDKTKITHKVGQSDSLHLVEIGNLEDDISQAAYAALQNLEYDFGEGEELFFTFEHDGEAYHAMFAPFKISYWPWLLGIYIPENDYMGSLIQNRTFMISITLVLGLLFSFICFLITRSILSSLKRLQSAAVSVGKGNLQNPLRIKTSYQELDETAVAFEYMRCSLEEYSSHMESLVCIRTKELEAKNSELAEEIKQRNKAEKELIYARNRADESRQVAEIANKAKNTFLANMSHEIRTPLSGIIGYTELIGRDNSGEVNEKFRETILQESERLIVLINRILDISKIESGQLTMDIKPFSLRKVIDGAWGDVHNLMETKGLDQRVEIDPEIPEFLLGDADLLSQILINLLSNSVKFTHEGYVSISVKAGESHKGELNLCFTIKDTGIGISPEEQDKVFKIFYQGEHSISGKYGGTGLGLSIVKELTELMKGTVSVNSSIESGSVFKLSIPFRVFDENPAVTKESHQGIIKSIQFKGVNILLAEDYSVNRDLIRHHLEGTGCQISIAVNGQEALDLFKRESPDIILMDIQMPGMNGLEATQAIRKSDGGQDICIIGVTANAFPHDLKNYWEAGMNDCLVKPFRKKDLFDKLNYWEQFSKNLREGKSEINAAKNVVFEYKVLMDMSEENHEMAELILDGFRTESLNALELFKQEESLLSIEDIHRSAHSMKSGSLNVGAFRLARAAGKLERAAKLKQSNLFEESIIEISKEFNLWGDAVREWEFIKS